MNNYCSILIQITILTVAIYLSTSATAPKPQIINIKPMSELQQENERLRKEIEELKLAGLQVVSSKRNPYVKLFARNVLAALIKTAQDQQI